MPEAEQQLDFLPYFHIRAHGIHEKEDGDIRRKVLFFVKNCYILTLKISNFENKK